MTTARAWLAVVLLAGCGAGTMGSPELGGDGGAAGGGDGGTAGGDAPGPGRDATFGDPACGLGAAAFCDTFDVVSPGGRAGELDDARWSASRLSPAGPTSDGKVFRIAPATVLTRREGATLEPCRADVPARVLPPDDTLICDPSAAIGSPHLLVAVAAQNYGENAYRVRRPFDFADRTGTIVFDAEVFTPNALLGWVSLDVTADPTPTPGFAQLQNFEGSSVPRDGFSLQMFDGACAHAALLTTAVDHREVFTDGPRGDACPATAWGHLNRFRVTVSRTRIEVYATPASDDGVTYGAEQLVNTFDVDLPFERGYVNLVVHNHATEKYWADYGAGFTDVDAWVARFDNVGFDGPIVDDGAREVDVPLPRAAGADGVDTGWLTPDRAGGGTARLTLPGVTIGGATRARLALTSWTCMPCEGEASDYVFHVRVNGGGWRDRTFSAGEQAAFGSGSGGLGIMLDLDVAALRDGDNVVEIATTDVPQNYPPGVLDATLVLD